MMLRVLLAVTLAGVLPAQTAVLEVPPVDKTVLEQVQRHLKAYYEDKRTPNYRRAISALSSRDPVTRAWGGKYLHALLDQSMKDKLAGRMPREDRDEDPRSRVDYKRFRESVGWDLRRANISGDGAEAYATAVWLLNAGEDYIYELDEFGIDLMRKIRTKRANRAIEQLLTKGHSRFYVLEGALREVGKRDLPECHAAVREHCGHYHERVRKIARYVAWQLELSDVPDYVPEKSLSRSLRKRLAEVVVMAKPLVPEGKSLKIFTVTYKPRDGEEAYPPQKYLGWLLATADGKHELRTLSGSEFTHAVAQTKVAPATLESAAAHFATIRKEFESGDRRSARAKVGIRRAFDSSGTPWEGSVPELLISAWALEQGKPKIVAEVLLPSLAKADDESQYVQKLTDQLATIFDIRMLYAFARERDYEKALGIARHLSQDIFKSFYHHDRAVRLARQLPQRMEDFKTLKLPTPKAWEAQKKEMSRKEQLEYLARRIRLIHSEQHSIPGSISYAADQFVDKYRYGDKRPDRAINPFAAIMHMNPTGDDLLVLLPYLSSDNYILAFDLQRFLPQNPQTLHPVCWVVANIFCETAQERIVDFGIVNGDDEAAKKAHVAKVREWCVTNKGKTLADRLVDRITDEGTDWEQVKRTFWNLYRLDEVRACEAVFRMTKGREDRKVDAARVLALLGRKEFVGHARDWVKSDNEQLRFLGSLLLLKCGDRKKKEGLAGVLARVEKGDTAAIHAALDVLLELEDPAVTKALDSLLSDDAPATFVLTLPFLQKLAQAGHVKAYELVKALLSGKSKRKCFHGLRWRRESISDPADIASYIRYAWQKEADQMPVPEDADKAEREALKKKAVTHVRSWIDAQKKRVAEGKKPDMKDAEIEVPWGGWRTFSSGWVRRFQP